MTENLPQTETVQQLADRLLGPGKSPARMRIAVGLALGAAALSLVVMALPLWLFPAPSQFLQAYSMGTVPLNLAWVIVIASPAAAAAWSAISTTRDTRSEVFALLRLTLLTPADRVRLRLRLALYRSRLLVASAVGFVPALIIGMFASAQRLYPFFITVPGTLPDGPSLSLQPAGPVGSRLPPQVGLALFGFNRLGDTPEFYGWVAGMCAALFLGVTLGVILSLRWQNAFIAALVGALLMPILELIPLLWIRLLDYVYLPDVAHLAAAVTLAAGPVAIALLLARLARRWV